MRRLSFSVAMAHIPQHWLRAASALAVVGLLAGACADDTASSPTTTTAASETTTTLPTTTLPTTTLPSTAPPFAVELAQVAGPVDGGSGMNIPQPASPLPAGYVIEEFFVSGEASSFVPLDGLPSDGMWSLAADETAAYNTRIVVRRPAAAEDFSGVVIVEWMNVTATEAAPDWSYLSEIVGDEGHAYVVMSAQALGVVGGDSLMTVDVDAEAAVDAGVDGQGVDNGGLVHLDPERYGTLVHPGDAYAYDMFSQVGAAIAAGDGGVLGGSEPTTLLAAGESQSAIFLTSYINGVHPLAPVYDGFFVHSRGATGAPIDGSFNESASDTDPAAAEPLLIRTDLAEPVFMVETETDLTLLGYAAARQPDTATVRTWEVAGTAHADAHLITAIIGGARTGTVGSFVGCVEPINSGPHHEATQAALWHLARWAQGGEAPPEGDAIEVAVDDGVTVIVRDELGTAVGGVRNPLVDVPVVVTTGDPWGGESVIEIEDFDICDLFGRTMPLDRDTLLELHGSADDYVEAFTAAAAAAVDAGFLLELDADQLLSEAEANRALFD